ncbi:hypothetical protein LSCM1_03767 [Leishmania martiniquensis]|uniref:Uncharacterized protein n=1 Tax=Leishmania martiniquensis TaxID=1580590 RepID=A0A836GZ61_9TRYP|nr:hypothetical protein LSCM1_03767 [Leishmania martiniquensis]
MAVFFGVKYISVEATALSCLFDSTTCEQHAVPLSVTGDVLISGLRPTRYRQQHTCLRAGQRRVPTAESDCSGLSPAQHRAAAPQKSTRPLFYEAAMRKLMEAEAVVAAPENSPDRLQATGEGEGRLEPTSDAAPWLERLREIWGEWNGSECKVKASKMERVTRMRAANRPVNFLFRSPYWVEVTGLYERWGVRVAPKAVPLRIGGVPYVNAEQTTDASRFTPSTCVPHLQQEVLFNTGLGTCTWAGSQRLLGWSVPAAAPRCRPGGVCAWTYSTLCERAAAVQGVSNLWIAMSVLERFGWTLRAVPAPPRPEMSAERCSVDPADGPDEVLCGALPLLDVRPLHLQDSLRHELEGELLHRQRQQDCGSPRETPSVADISLLRLCRHTTQLHCSVVHSSCIVEEAELKFLAGYSPTVLIMCVPELNHEDWGFDAWKAAEQKAIAAARSARARSTGPEGGEDTMRCSTGARVEGLRSACDGAEWVGEEDGSEAFEDDAAHGAPTTRRSVSALQKRACLMHLCALRRKRYLYSKSWKGAALTFQSRLDLAYLALRKGYSASNAAKWVSLDFLRGATRIRAARSSKAVPKVDAQCADETQLAHPVPAAGSPTAASSAGRSAVPLPTRHGTTGIEVDVLVYPSFSLCVNSPCAADDRDMKGGHRVGGNNGDIVDDCSGRVQLVKLALINSEELEWPEWTSRSREQWIWKAF